MIISRTNIYETKKNFKEFIYLGDISSSPLSCIFKVSVSGLAIRFSKYNKTKKMCIKYMITNLIIHLKDVKSHSISSFKWLHYNFDTVYMYNDL